MSREYLRELREKQNMSMQFVADRIGISRQYYQLIEAGERQKKMDITLVLALSNLFGISAEQIISHEKESISAESEEKGNDPERRNGKGSGAGTGNDTTVQAE